MITDLVEVMGDASRYGHPVSLAPLLSTLDIAAGRCSALFSGGPVVTGCFDQVNVHAPINHGDLVAVAAKVLSMGRSSMVLRLLATHYLPPTSDAKPKLIASAYATFIAVDTNTKRPRPLPSTATLSSQPLRHDEPHLRLISQEQPPSKRLLDSFSVQRKQLNAKSTPQRHDDAFRHLQTISFSQVLPVHQTEVTIRKHFLPRNQNQAGLIFGGDILATLEQAALTCASRTQSTRMITVATRNIAFLAPVQLLSLLHVVARVIACTRDLVVVLVRSYVDQEHNRFELQPSHYGVFYLERQDSQPIETGVHAWSTTEKDDLHRVLSLPLLRDTAR